MRLKDQVCTLEQAIKLKELGIAQGKSYAAFIKNLCQKDKKFWLEPVTYPGCSNEGYEDWTKGCLQGYSAFTVAELAAMVPDYTPTLGNLEISKAETDHVSLQPNRKKWWNVSYWIWSGGYEGDRYIAEKEKRYLHQADTMAQALASILIHLLENNLITAEAVNARLK